MAENLVKLINALTNPKRGKGRLGPAPSRKALGQSRAEVLPTGEAPDDGSSGIISPLVEQAYTGSTFYSLTSSDGLFIFEFGDQTEYIDDDGAGTSIVVKHIDPEA